MLVSQKKYAEMCGVSKQAVNERVKRGTLLLTGRKIDTKIFPPIKGRRSFGGKTGLFFNSNIFDNFSKDVDYKNLKGSKI